MLFSPQRAHASASIRQPVSGISVGGMVALKMIYPPYKPVIVTILGERVFEM